ncbi:MULTISPECIES: methyl-accepting chemotaxis protein [unclassified Colwellia]|jgi:methyl-accepting chemotaxis protein|uniref:methyl-accepting chemotaxis protein n=1 Tax=unclassified Colwellia TaxID=196834 RepID=UPI0015F3DEAD|nr:MULTISPECIES: methyl-accepting chemotaxis protein [unclassified Colwellia]MBA6346836.1 methyl-accepting chemotaxis protein [Colwellia sp. BRX8-9]MBA6380208.1 methyl-accepting chemotaxis protein [Colwellia sp. BRX10-7]MBA6382282.1 methyl-accepting chemotaxis protein [Colwellia sp. BRX10-9]MBA6387486.1 methyl-accepting chemotaxis protein [Colwellia sp. BRX10-2]MBA6394718.1 methyl-accepting chemotaxis protein [Colwellia sp. BRX10-6]
MLIKHKLIANTGILVLSMVFMLGLLNFTMSSLETDIKIAREIGNIETEILQLRRNEKDFLARKDIKYFEAFSENYAELIRNIGSLEQAYETIGKDLPELNKLRAVLNDYQQFFKDLVDAQKDLGLSSTDGLYGSLRSAVHVVEESIGNSDYKLLSNMLQLRRNEKDFMLRLDAKYVDRWNNNASSFVQDINVSDLSSDAKSQAIDNISLYEQAFTDFVAGQKRLGFTAKEGLKGDMRNAVHQVDEILDKLVLLSKNEVVEHTKFVDLVAYSVFFSILLIAISFAFFVSRSILLSINQLNETMKKVADTQDLSLTVSTHSDDELGEMATIFNNMLGKFRNLITAVNLSVDTVHEATDSLSKNIHLANAGVDSQIQQTDMVATAVTQMVATVDEIANNTNAAASKAEATNNNAISGKEGVEQTIAKIDELSEKLRESENIVHELAKDSDTIGSVLDVIRGIAEQTNLLALNAAIEAARAGEQGRGFAVVADEVRTLASRTQDSTQEIETIISSLQGRTKEIVSHMAICRTQGQDSADQASSAGKMLEEITYDVSTIMEMNTAIASAIQEQSTVASEVNQHVVEIRDVAEQAGLISHQNAQMSEELSQQAAVLNNEVSQFKV